MADPNEVVSIAGTVRAMEQSWRIDESGATGLGTVKMAHKMRVDPDEVRQARTGEGWIVTRGRATRITVLRTRIPADVLHDAENLVAHAWAQGVDDLLHGRWAEPQPWWDLVIEGRPARLELEAGSFGELMEGEPAPPALPPVPTAPDPRLILAITAYVRAGLVAQAVDIARQADGDIPNPERYVRRLAARRAEFLAGPRRAHRLRIWLRANRVRSHRWRQERRRARPPSQSSR
jgi:hypothetical protein